jgi:hypothetical protein
MQRMGSRSGVYVPFSSDSTVVSSVWLGLSPPVLTGECTGVLEALPPRRPPFTEAAGLEDASHASLLRFALFQSFLFATQLASTPAIPRTCHQRVPPAIFLVLSSPPRAFIRILAASSQQLRGMRRRILVTEGGAMLIEVIAVKRQDSGW